jgi:hypothetical protein
LSEANRVHGGVRTLGGRSDEFRDARITESAQHPARFMTPASLCAEKPMPTHAAPIGTAHPATPLAIAASALENPVGWLEM